MNNPSKLFNEKEYKIGCRYQGQLIFEGNLLIDYRPCPLNTKGWVRIYQIIEQLHTHIFRHIDDDQLVFAIRRNPHAFMCGCEKFIDNAHKYDVEYKPTHNKYGDHLYISIKKFHCKHIQAVIDWSNEA